MKHLIVYGLCSMLLASCTLETTPIRYGEDACHHCEMTIVDKAYAAQAVSSKGKQYKYDAIECMALDLLEDDYEPAIQKVADYTRPDNMIAVDKAVFIINDSIKSPMGKHLAAIPKEHPVAINNPHLLHWNSLLDIFKKK